MNMPLLDADVVATRTVVIHDPELQKCYQVTVPARTEEDAWRFLLELGSAGVTGTAVQNAYLGAALPVIRKNYYKSLAVAEAEIAAKRLALGAKLGNYNDLYSFTEWASNKRTAIARKWRIPAGPGGMIGGEIRDWRQYGTGGRTFENLVKRAEGKGLTGEAALLKILDSVDRPNPAVTESILKGARYLKGAGAVLFLGGTALTGYNVASAPEGQSWEVAKREGVGALGGFVGSNIVVGVCFLLGMTGVGLVVVGLIGGLAGVYAAEQMYLSREKSRVVQQMMSGQVVHVSGFADFTL